MSITQRTTVNWRCSRSNEEQGRGTIAQWQPFRWRLQFQTTSSSPHLFLCTHCVIPEQTSGWAH